MEHLSKQLDGNKWECSVACRKVSDNDAQAMIELIESFNMPIEELREDLELVDSECPYMHHVRLRKMNVTCPMLRFPSLGIHTLAILVLARANFIF